MEQYPSTSTEGGETWPDVRSLQFGKRTVIAAVGNTVFVGIGERNEIAEYDAKKLVRIIRNGAMPAPVTAEIREQSQAGIRALYEASKMPESLKATVKAQLKLFKYAEVYPFYARLIVGDDSTLWAEDDYITENEGRQYVVYNPSGRAIARVSLPARVRGFGFSRTQIVGTILDDNDVPHVVVWRVVPPSKS